MSDQLPLIKPESNWQAPTSLPDLRNCKYVALDRETKDLGLSKGKGPGWATYEGYILGVSLAWREGNDVRSTYINLRHPDSEFFSPQVMAQWEIDHAKAGVTFVMQNAPYDIGWGDIDLGVPPPAKLDDTIAMANMVDETRFSFSLNNLCAWRGIPLKDNALLEEAGQAYGFKQKEVMNNLWKLPARYVGPYAEQDAQSTLLLAESLRPELKAQDVENAYQLEIDLIPMVHAMRKRGIRIDINRAEQLRDEFKKSHAIALADLSERLGTSVTIEALRSRDFLEKAFNSQSIAFPRTAPTPSFPNGQPSFESQWMKRMDHWLPKLVVRARTTEEAASKFLQGYILDYAKKDRIHASINQFRSEEGGTRTYRFSYSDPPLQQMPKKNEDLHVVRDVFLPEEGTLWMRPDYSQQEYRLIVHYAEKMNLAKAKEAGEQYRKDPNTSFHKLVAEMTGLPYQQAKDTNFAKSYGAGAAKFAFMINKSIDEARLIMQKYDHEMPFSSLLFQYCQNIAARRGYIKLLDGARIHYNRYESVNWESNDPRKGLEVLPCDHVEARKRKDDPNHPWYGKLLKRADTRKAMNALIQGGAARMTKLAMRTCWRAGLVPMLQLHDELDFSVETEKQGEDIITCMRDAVRLTVPMLVEAGYGPTWAQATRSWQEVAHSL